jgi:ribosome-associated translation inhibitor RaiA
MIDVAVTTRGEVSAQEKEQARERVAQLDRFVPDPVLAGRVMLRAEPNPRLEHPARAEAELDVNGRLVCGRVSAPTMGQAIAQLAETLERQLEDFSARRTRRQRQQHRPADGEWRHGNWSPPRPAYLRRPTAERELLRRKTFAVEPLDPLQAVGEMLDLDHDFYLFRNARTDSDAVLYRRDDGGLGLIEQPEAEVTVPAQEHDWLTHETSRFSTPIALESAISQINELGHRFLFFRDADGGRGKVLYMRYDGHYGLVEPGD